MERYVAIDNVCAWPILTRLPNDEIAAIIFNQPTHGRWEGDIECWVSTDEGRFWQLRGVPAPHEPGTNRMNAAAGLAPSGALIAIVSGYSPKPPPGHEPLAGQPQVLDSWVCRSTDAGATWSHTQQLQLPQGVTSAIPYGAIDSSAEGFLGASCYSWDFSGACSAYFLRSRDDGHTWGEATLIAADDYNETNLLCLGNGRWLAACRTAKDGHVDLFVSGDGGETWALQDALTLPRQHPGHLLHLADGRILLTYGIRNLGYYGIGARLSDDQGHSWGAPIFLANWEGATDGGYPYSIQDPDGTVITAYYCNRFPGHARYHMGVARWHPGEQNSR